MATRRKANVDLGVVEMKKVDNDEREVKNGMSELEIDTSSFNDNDVLANSSELENHADKSSLNDSLPPFGTNSFQVGVHSLSKSSVAPKYATAGSACFDLHADFEGNDAVTVYTSTNQMKKVIPRNNPATLILLEPHDRALIPTNLIFDIPSNMKMMIYSRSGLSLKQGLILANAVGVIDSDYVEPVYVMLVNKSNVRVSVTQGDRIAQAEIVPAYSATFQSLSAKPKQKTNRIGGFGSTGTQ